MRAFHARTPEQQRKPSGPRAMAGGRYTPDRVAAAQRTQYRGSPNALDNDSLEDLTF